MLKTQEFRLKCLMEKIRHHRCEIQLLENRMIGDRDTHRLNLKGVLGGTWKMNKIIGKL